MEKHFFAGFTQKLTFCSIIVIRRLVMIRFKRVAAFYRQKIIGKEGFTLIELMVVITILSILAIIVVPKIMDLPAKAKVTSAKTQISSFKTALVKYQSDNDRYPSTEQGLNALVQKPESDPNPQNWTAGGYLDKKTVPLDPWNHPYVYTCEDGQNYEITSYGADGKEGGTGINADIKSSE
jgi:general secretion pathway protein G